jgi:hypothetical protein
MFLYIFFFYRAFSKYFQVVSVDNLHNQRCSSYFDKYKLPPLFFALDFCLGILEK